MRALVACALLLLPCSLLLAPCSLLHADEPPQKPSGPKIIREIFVPAEDLNVLLDGADRRVLLTRAEYEKLLAEAKEKPAELKAPIAVALVAADYQGRLEDGRARLSGTLTLEVLEEDLCALPLPLSGVGLTSATLDGQPAALGRDPSGGVVLFVRGKGRHELKLELTAAVELSAAQQAINCQIPTPPATRLHLSVPGDVEVKAGAPLVARTVEQMGEVRTTQLDVLLPRGPLSLVLSLNNKLLQQNRVVTARSVLVDEVTAAYERLHATVSLAVLHGATDQFSFALPEGFEVTSVSSPLLSQWRVEGEGAERVLHVALREPTTQTVVLKISALRPGMVADAWAAVLGNWKMPQLIPRDVAGSATVVGLFVEDRLRADAIAATDLEPIDVDVLTAAMPETVLLAEPGAPRIRAVAAYYAPRAGFDLKARFERPAPRFTVSTNLLLTLVETRQQVLGGFALRPEFDPLLSFDFSAPAGWTITEVTAADGTALPFERYDPPMGMAMAPARIRVKLPAAIQPGQVASVNFQAEATPAGWLGEWSQSAATFPAFAVLGAAREEGAISVLAGDDLVPRPDKLTGLSPLSQDERALFRLADKAAQLAYRFDAQPYELQMIVERTAPDVTARAYHFARISPGSLDLRSEMQFDVRLARTGQLRFRLPASTPESISITGRDGLVVKETRSEVVKGERIWTALLGERKSGLLKLVVEFNQRLDQPSYTGFALPLAVADGVAYQSSLVSVEGGSELDIEAKGDGRRVDIGELVDAEYQPGKRVVGVFGFLGDAPRLAVDIAERKPYGLVTTIVERAELVTRVAASGTSVTAARYHLRTKAQYLEIALPADARFWTALVDGRPTKPQRDREGKLLLGWAATEQATLRDVQIVYELPAPRLGISTEVRLEAPRLYIRAERGAASEEAPLADLAWQLIAPPGYKVVRSRGTVEPTEETMRILPAAKAAAAVYYLAGGVDLFHSHRTSGWRVFMPGAKYAPGAVTYNGIATDDSHYSPATPGETSYEYSEAPRSSTTASRRALLGEVDKLAEMQDETARTESFDLPPPTAEPTPQPVNPTAETPPPPTEPATDPNVPVLPPLVASGTTSVDDILGPATRMGREGRPGGRPVGGGEARTRVPIGLNGQRNDQFFEHGVMAGEPLVAQATPGRSGTVNATTVPTKNKTALWALEGVSSLPIEVAPLPGEMLVTFQSLGAEPLLQATLAEEDRWQMLAWGVFGLIVLIGLALTTSSTTAKLRLVVGVLLLVTLLPLVTGAFEEFDAAFDAAFLAACLVGIWYLGVAAYNWLRECITSWWATRNEPAAPAASAPTTEAQTVNPTPAATTTAMLLLCLSLLAFSAAPAVAQDLNMRELGAQELPEGAIEIPGGIVIPVGPLPPVKLPTDAIVIPYDAEDAEGLAKADKVLVPYAEYERLFRLANPDAKLPGPTPAPYGLAGAKWEAALVDGDALILTGHLTLDVLAEGTVSVPLVIGDGVLSLATLDGKPARAALVGVAPPAQPNGPGQQQAAPNPQPNLPPGNLTMLYVEGQGRHELDLVVRIKLERRGGWRIAAGRVPRAPATTLTLTVPAAKTDVRLAGLPDKREYETTAANQKIETVLGDDGGIRVEWRPQITEAMVDRSLAANSTAVLDVREDGLRMVWEVALSFPRGQLDNFTLAIPQGYLVEHVSGTNVRGWQQKAAAGRDELAITLLQAARDRQAVTVHLAKRVKSLAELADFAVPVVSVVDAALERGLVTIRRSPLVDLRTTKLDGVSRADIPADSAAYVDQREGAHESPLGVRAFQTYQFQSTPFTVQLAAEEITSQASAELQTLAKISPRDVRLETRLTIRPQGRPVHRVQIAIPAGLDIDRVDPAEELEWSLGQQGERRVLNIYLKSGRSEPFSLLLFATALRPAAGGMAAAGEANPEVTLPTFDVLGVTKQEGDIVVTVDPVFDVQPVELKGCESILLSRTYGWLGANHRPLARLALHYSAGDHGAKLKIVRRATRVSVVTITNVRLTERAIEETVYLEFNIQDAGVREVNFQLPERFKEARVSTASLRQKTTTIVPDAAGNRVRFRLELQDEILGQLRVLVVHDRLLVAEKQTAPIPLVETGTLDRQYVTLQNTGRDELEVVEASGLDALERQQMAWHVLRDLLQHDMTVAYLARGDSRSPSLAYHTVARKLVATASAKIGIAEAKIGIDASGAYRGEQIYHVDNRTEPFLLVELPEGVRLWTARVAGEPVKPAPDPTKANLVRIPLVKTAAGERDYEVVLQYGGRMPPLGNWSRVEIPLLRPMNLQPERSNVRLFLPKSHRWGLFGGTARNAADDTALVEGYTSYRTKQVQELWETVNRDAGVYTKARAASNLKELQTELRSFNDMNRGRASESETYRQALQENEQALQLVEQNGRVLAVVDDSKSLGEDDNRVRLGALVREQENQRGVNVVNDAGGNFTLQPNQPPADRSGNGKFQADWFRSNGLDNPDAQRLLTRGEGDEKPRPGADNKPTDPGKPGSKDGRDYDLYEQTAAARIQLPSKRPAGEAQQHGPAQGQGQAQGQGGKQLYVPDVAQGEGKKALEELAQGQQAQTDFGRGDGEKGKVQRYQERYSRELASQQLSQPGPGVGGPGPGVYGGGRSSGGGIGGGGYGGNVDGTRPGRGPNSGSGAQTWQANGNQPFAAMNGIEEAAIAFDDREMASLGVPPISGEYSSLSVNLAFRGDEYFFTAPRGEVTITAQTIDDSLVERLQQAGIVLAVILAAWFVYAVVRGGLAGLLIVLGLAGLVVGILSLAAAILLVVGIVMAIVDWRRGPQAVAG